MAKPTFTPHPLGDKQWKELQNLEPDDVCRRSCARFDAQEGYAIDFMEKEYRLSIDKERTEGPDGEVLALDSELQLLLLTYLLSAQEVPFSGKRISEKDIPGGELFFRGPHALPTNPLIERFGRNPKQFLEIGTALGGKRIAYGDVAIEFLALPRIPVACVLWAEDEEFPARVTFLFDSSIDAHLPLDVVLALVRSVVKILCDSRNGD
jgi:hypothetical protein